MSELKNRLKELILLYTGLSLVISCTLSQYPDSIEQSYNISVRYYITKEAEKTDETKLKDVISNTASDNIKNVAGTLLGGYYYKIGEFNKSKKYLNKYVKDLHGDIRTAGSVWMASILKSENNPEYSKIAGEVTSNDDLSKFLINKSCDKGKEFCLKELKDTKMGKPVKVNPKDINAKEAPTIVKKQKNKKTSDSIEDRKPKQLRISVVEGNYEDEAFKGIILAAGNDNRTAIDVHTDTVESGNYLINVKNQKVHLQDRTINFKINYKPAVKKIAQIIKDDTCDDVVVGVNDQYVDEGIYAKSLLEGKIKNLQFENYEAESFKSLRYMLDDTKNAKKCFIGIGTEKEMTKFLPLVRYISPSEKMSKIYIITDIYTGIYEKEDFIDYFKNVEIFTFINAKNEKNSNNFLKSYQKIYTKKPGSKAFIGYDMVRFLQKEVRYKNVNYVSSIEDINENKVRRKIHRLIIDEMLQVKVKDLPSNEDLNKKPYQGFTN